MRGGLLSAGQLCGYDASKRAVRLKHARACSVLLESRRPTRHWSHPLMRLELAVEAYLPRSAADNRQCPSTMSSAGACVRLDRGRAHACAVLAGGGWLRKFRVRASRRGERVSGDRSAPMHGSHALLPWHSF